MLDNKKRIGAFENQKDICKAFIKGQEVGEKPVVYFRNDIRNFVME